LDLIWQLLDPSWTQLFLCDQADGRQARLRLRPNPQARNLFGIVNYLQETEGVRLKFGLGAPPCGRNVGHTGEARGVPCAQYQTVVALDEGYAYR
jgi:hypothetical protein